MMKTMLWAALLAMFMMIGGSLPAMADLSCTASVTEVAFGTITGRGGISERTTGTLEIRCTGAQGTEVHACLSLGAGSGGASAGFSTRDMKRPDGTPLTYTLRTGGYAGDIWTDVSLTSQIGASGEEVITATLYAEMISAPATIRAGSYSSSFSGADAGFSYGASTCSETGGSPSFAVSATVVPSCTLSVAALDFGTMSTLADAVDGATTITADCTSDTAYSISLDQGHGYADGMRHMSNAGAAIAYGVYRDPARTAAWTDGAGAEAGTGVGVAQEIPVYGRIPSQQTPHAGTYADTVIVTITY